MATSKRLSAHREAVRVGAESEPDDDKPFNPDEPGDEDRENPPTTTSKKGKKSMTDEEMKAAIDAARTEGREAGLKSANDRANTVSASEHYAGREAAAAKMLGKSNMSAEDIIDLLADMPKAQPQAAASALTEEQQRAAAEEAGRQEMKAALEENKNSDVDAGTGGDGKPDKRKAADDVWTKAYGLTEGAK